MPTAEEDFDRFSLVSSLYGPGSIGCWLCTVASVLITWTLNVGFRDKDSITNDLLAALTIPAVAAGHVIFCLFSSAAPPSQTYDPKADLNTTAPNIIQVTAAIAAPLNVCGRFATAAVALLVISALWGHRKRFVSVLAVCLFCFSVESIVFFQRRSLNSLRSNDNLSPPSQSNVYTMWTSVHAILGVERILFFIILVAILATAPSQGEEVAANAEQEKRGRRLGVLVATRGESELVGRIRLLLIIFCLLHGILSLITPGTELLGAPEYVVKEFWISWTALFVPKSGNSLSELDQAVSLAVGVVALLFSLYDAYKSRRKEVNRRSVEEMELTEQPTVGRRVQRSV